jgi:hypothetical protein
MSEQDIQQTARFAREFVTMNLVPWMEKYVIEWNETVSVNESTPYDYRVLSPVFLEPKTTVTLVFINASAFWYFTCNPNALLYTFSSRTFKHIHRTSVLSIWFHHPSTIPATTLS